ncbi:hypothetical protein GCM10010967_48610 [Dyadobacter beijingensis]|uniref:Uncharacterized protein n=1 Tax=Dyadobacter beijingensis TaxID=365489 RepID=A0ABQ2IDY0_9BACT|nr:hypothetical protein [Dyadobacter beijingensis]GGN07338.1 hypothetical protein GCM10010967_48610 [Dyadobacter beijingensis]
MIDIPWHELVVTDRHFRIPLSVNKYSYEGVFDIHFTIDTDGVPAIDSIDFSRMKSRAKRISAGHLREVQSDIRTEMDRVFDRIPEWTPATVNGVRISYPFKLPFSVYFD